MQVSGSPVNRGDGPGKAVLWQLYVNEERGFADLTARYRVSKTRLRRWLVEAGIEIRPRSSGGHKRQLTAPPAAELAEVAALYERA